MSSGPHLDVSPLWPADLDHLRLDSPDPKALADFYERALGMTVSPLDGDTYLAQGRERRLVIGRGAARGHPYSAFALADDTQLERYRRFACAEPAASFWRRYFFPVCGGECEHGRAEHGSERNKEHPGHVDGRKILPQRHELPGRGDRSGYKKPLFYWVFRGGTALADQSVSKQQPRDAAFFGVPLCCSPLAPRRP